VSGRIGAADTGDRRCVVQRTNVFATVLAVVASAAVSTGAASAATGWTAYVVNQGPPPYTATESMTPIATATGKAGTPISVGQSPHAIAITPNGATAYVVNLGTQDDVQPINLATGQAQTAITGVGTEPIAIAITPNGQTAWVVDDATPGALTPIDLATGKPGTPITGLPPDPQSIAISSSGSTAYVVNEGSGTGGTIIPVNLTTGAIGTGIPAGDYPVSIAITPNSQTAYVGQEDVPGTVVEIDLAANPPTTKTISGLGAYPGAVAISPNGATAWIGDNPGLVPINTATNAVGTQINLTNGGGDFAITPDGTAAYVSELNFNTVTPVNLTTGVAGTPMTGFTDPLAITMTPDQAPTAAFTATPASPGAATSFNAAASSSPVGTVSSYAWNFGDGQTVTTTTPATTHVYATAGAYKVTLTVTNSAGTSLSQVFTGQTATLNGGSSAESSQTVTVAAPIITKPPPAILTPTLTQVAQSHAIWREGSALATIAKRRTASRPVGTRFTFTLNEAARVTLTFTRKVAGRSVKRRCVAATRANRRRRKCERTVTAGTLSFSAPAGADSIAFAGRLSRAKRLAAGHYTVAIAAEASGRSSATSRLRFTIVAAK
jgi:DNA-binding beta-propeller fold protein YncE